MPHILRAVALIGVDSVFATREQRMSAWARLARDLDKAKLDSMTTVEPMSNLPVIKDLVVDMQPFWDRVQAVTPWLQPSGPEPEREYIVPNEAMLDVAEDAIAEMSDLLDATIEFPVNVRVCHNNNAVVTDFFNVKLFTDACSYCSYEVYNFLA